MAEDTDNQLFARVTLERGVLTARLVGPSIGQREGPVIGAMVKKQLEANSDIAWIVLDFAEVDFINSAGIGACVGMHNDAKGRKAKVVLHAMRANLKDVFKMTRLDKIFTITDDDKRLAKVVGR